MKNWKHVLKRVLVLSMALVLIAGIFQPETAMAAKKRTVVTFQGKTDNGGKKCTVKVTFDKKSGDAVKVKFKCGKKTKIVSKISSPGNDPSVYWSDDMSFSMCIWYKNEDWTIKNANKIVVTDNDYSGTYKRK